jgi:integrase
MTRIPAKILAHEKRGQQHRVSSKLSRISPNIPPKTLSIIAALSNLFGYAFKIGATPENPLLTIEKPRLKRARPAILNEKEFATLLNHARTQRRFDVLSWLVLGGLVGPRPYEVLRLEWTGIHLQTREIRVEPGWTKTHRARVVPLQPNALEWLRLVAGSYNGEDGKSDAVSLNLEQSMATLEARGRYAAACPLVGRQR